MTGGLYVVSELTDPETGETVRKRTDAIDGATAIALCARLNQRCYYSRIVSASQPIHDLPVALDWDKFAADWFREPAPRLFERAYFAAHVG
jgi:hypothetical protein